MLNAQCAHRGMAGAVYFGRMWKREIWALLDEQPTVVPTDICSVSVSPFHQDLNSSVT